MGGFGGRRAPMVAVDGGFDLFYSANNWDSSHYAVGVAALYRRSRAPHQVAVRASPWPHSPPSMARGVQPCSLDGQGRLQMAFQAMLPGSVGYPHPRLLFIRQLDVRSTEFPRRRGRDESAVLEWPPCEATRPVRNRPTGTTHSQVPGSGSSPFHRFGVSLLGGRRGPSTCPEWAGAQERESGLTSFRGIRLRAVLGIIAMTTLSLGMTGVASAAPSTSGGVPRGTALTHQPRAHGKSPVATYEWFFNPDGSGWVDAGHLDHLGREHVVSGGLQ